MKKTAIILAFFLLLSLFTGCGAERAKVDISDGGDLTATETLGKEAETTPEIETETEPTTEEDVSGAENTPTETEPEAEYVTLSYDGNTASVTVDSVCLAEDGKLAVALTGTGYTFNGILPIRNGKLVVPFGVDVEIGGTRYSWNTANFDGNIVTYFTDATELPDQIILYSNDNKDKEFTFDAAPFITGTPSVKEDGDDSNSIMASLAGRWSGTGKPVGGGEEISLRIDLQEDGTGTYQFRQGGYTESYPVSVNDEAGSFSAEIPADNTLQITGCGGTYELDGDVLLLHIVTEFASGRSFEYDVDCERVPPAETVTDEPYTMVTSKFSVKGLYTGEWRDGKPNGTGTLTIQETNDRWDTGDTLWSEDWVDGLIEGYGEWRSAVDGAYDGNFSSGLKDGYGRMWFGDGRVYDGKWSHGSFKG